MINKIIKSVNYRSANQVYFTENRERIGISKTDFVNLKKQGHRHNDGNKIALFGHKIGYTSPYWLLHSLDEIFVQEVYKFKTEKRDPKILDVGANVGLSVIYFKRQFPDCKIIAFEPDPEIYAVLKENSGAFGFKDIELLNKAAWIRETELAFEPDGFLGGQLAGNSGETAVTRRVTVNAVRLKDYLAEPVDFLKIDIEGAEHEVIRDCSGSFHQVKNMFVEYHQKKNEKPQLHELLSILSAEGFTYYIKEAWVNKQHPFVDEAEGGYDMQLNISCFRP